jgi:hypothetical protein
MAIALRDGCYRVLFMVDVILARDNASPAPCATAPHVDLTVIWIPGYYSTDLVRTLFLCSYGAMGR